MRKCNIFLFGMPSRVVTKSPQLLKNLLFRTRIFRSNATKFIIALLLFTIVILRRDLGAGNIAQEIAETQTRDVLLHARNEYNMSVRFTCVYIDNAHATDPIRVSKPIGGSFDTYS